MTLTKVPNLALSAEEFFNHASSEVLDVAVWSACAMASKQKYALGRKPVPERDYAIWSVDRAWAFESLALIMKDFRYSYRKTNKIVNRSSSEF